MTTAKYTRDNYRKDLRMVEENFHGLTVPFMKDNGRMIKPMD